MGPKFHMAELMESRERQNKLLKKYVFFILEAKA
jgi:hypothetical protein